MAETEHRLRLWRLHPDGCPIRPAEKTLGGEADRDGVRYCGPFTNANKAGWWLFPPVDMDIVWRGGREFEWDVLTPYTNADELLIRLLADEEADAVDRWLLPGGRSKFTFGKVGEGIVQIWSGCIFQTPPGWNLYLRSPANFPARPFRVMDAVLETDWLQYDVWLNLIFEREGTVAQLRRDGWPPLAHLVPVRRETHEVRWDLTEETISRNSPEAEAAFEYFVQYNKRKFASGGRNLLEAENPELGLKDSSTYYKEKKRMLREVGREGQESPDTEVDPQPD
jgi:uncharacterized protein DUF6065